MRRSRSIKALAITLALGLVSFTTYKLAFSRNQLIVDILMSGLENAHYAPQKVDDAFSQKVFDLYLKRLDYNKKFLLQSDVDELSKYRNDIDDQIKGRTFELFNLSQSIITKRIQEKEALYKELLSMPFDYKVDEEYETDPDKTSWAKTEADLKNEWRKSLQYQTLLRINDELNTQEKAAEKKDTIVKILPFDSIEVKSRKKVVKLNDAWFKRLKKYSDKDRFAAYMNCVTALYDPHTEFFPPEEKKQFDQGMSGQMEGIGAKLQQREDGSVKITEIVVGSPSYKQGELKAGDIIMSVAQGEGKSVDIAEMELDDAIKLIKGKKGTEVRLTVKKPDGTVKIIPIIRDVIQLDDTFVKSAIVENGKKKFGYIRLPVFYSDFTKNGARRCGQDVKTEAIKLKNAGVDGIIIDLRDNGGGSLSEVIDMVGHFITTGPVVQVQRKGGKKDVYSDYNPEVAYDGPMAVLINRNSASASEIFAAAMQDYKRALIVGSPTSFGKGTVQQFLDLDNYLLPEFDTVKPLGAVKVTMQKFYRVNGGATQLRGVSSDIVLPDAYSMLETGEKELDYPMPWDEIPSADYKALNNINYDKVKKKSAERVKKNKTFTLVEEEAQYFKNRKDDTKYTLNLEKFRAEDKKTREEIKKYDDLKSEIKGFDAGLVKVDVDAMQSDTIKLSREKKWAEGLKKDFYIHETTNMLMDMK